MVLRMGSGSVAGMRPVMWPYMLELILPEPYTDAVGNICLSIANILKGDMAGLVTDLNYDEMGEFYSSRCRLKDKRVRQLNKRHRCVYYTCMRAISDRTMKIHRETRPK